MIGFFYKNKPELNAMKKRIVLLMTVAAVICLSACGKVEEKAGASATEKVDEMASQAQETMEGIDLPSESVTKAVSDTWIVPDTEEVYTLQADGTGDLNGDPFTFECGFDDQNHITLKITMDDVSAQRDLWEHGLTTAGTSTFSAGTEALRYALTGMRQKGYILWQRIPKTGFSFG